MVAILDAILILIHPSHDSEYLPKFFYSYRGPLHESRVKLRGHIKCIQDSLQPIDYTIENFDQSLETFFSYGAEAEKFTDTRLCRWTDILGENIMPPTH
jgi:hypothetical protein